MRRQGYDDQEVAMKALIFFSVLIVPILFSCSGYLQSGGQGLTSADMVGASRPENASYLIGDNWVQLTDGYSVIKNLSDVSSKTVTRIFSQTEFGDLDKKFGDDAALLLMQQCGGSGSFFYLTAALDAGGLYRGTNAVFLGDRIAPLSVTIRDKQIVVLYSDRRTDEPMVTMPTVIKARRFRMEGSHLMEVTLSASESGQLTQGWVTIGHEVRSFQSCDDKQPGWLLGDSPALPEIKTAHSHALFVTPPYFPLFMQLSGVTAAKPEDGFGSVYQIAFRANRLSEADPRGYCRNELIEVDNPVPGASVSSEIIVSGKARGSWYFEGDFPLLLTDDMGQVIAQGFASAQGPWMTTDWVPFTGRLEFQRLKIPGWGWIVFKKDNPSDRRELGAEVAIPVLLE